MSIDTTELQENIVADLTTELSGESGFSADLLNVKVKLAIKDVIMRRNYAVTSMTSEQILADLDNYYATITSLARYDYNQIGAEGEKSHSENGITRGFVERDTLLNGVHAFVSVL